jgi:hypothetical protein
MSLSKGRVHFSMRSLLRNAKGQELTVVRKADHVGNNKGGDEGCTLLRRAV